MKNIGAGLLAFLNSNQQMVIADLYTFTVQVPSWSGGVGGFTPNEPLTFGSVSYYYTSFDTDITFGGTTWTSSDAIMERDAVKSVIGVQVDSMKIKAYASNAMLIQGVPFLQACITGVLDNAVVSLDRAYMDASLNVQGVVNMFAGRVATVQAGRTAADLTIHSDLELLNISMPRNLYQAGCQHTVFSGGCGLARKNFYASGVVGAGSTASVIVLASMSQAKPAGYWDLGGIFFASGANANTLITVKSFNGTAATLMKQLPVTPSAGDAIYIYPGCDKTYATCGAKFSNQSHFKGFPLVPVPETMR